MATYTMETMTDQELEELKKKGKIPPKPGPITGGPRPMAPQTGGPRPMGPDPFGGNNPTYAPQTENVNDRPQSAGPRPFGPQSGGAQSAGPRPMGAQTGGVTPMPNEGPKATGGVTPMPNTDPVPKIISDPGPGLLGRDFSSDINNLYQQYLGRDAAQAGMDYWNQTLAGGATLDDLRYNIAQSDEARNVADQRIQDAFQGLLGRQAKQAGLEYWRNDLLQGKSVDDLNFNIRQSPEFASRVTSQVAQAYTEFLGRQPTAEESQAFLQAAQQGRPLEDILLDIQGMAPLPEPTPEPPTPAPTPDAPVDRGQSSTQQAADEAQGYDPTLAQESGTAEAQQADVATREVTPEQTVQFQLNQILNSDSPILESARTRGRQYANSRGLLNSSIAAQASEQAAIDSALQIAQQDAATFAGADAQSVEAANRAALQDASLGTNVSMFNVGEENVTNRFNADSINQAGQFNADAANTAIQGFLNREAQRALQDDQQLFTAEQNQADRDLRQYLQERQFDFTSQENALDRGLQTALQENQFAFTGEQNQMDRTLAQQESALDRALQTALQESQFEFTGDQNALDRALRQQLQNEQLTWTGTQNDLDRALQSSLTNAQISSNEAIANAKIAAQAALQETQLAFSANQAQLDRDFQTAYQNNNFAFQATQLAQQHAFQSMEAQASRDFNAWQQQNQNDWAATQAALDREFKTYQVNAQTASTIMYSTMDGIAAIYADPNLTSSQKTQAANNIMNQSLQMPGLLENITNRMDPDYVPPEGENPGPGDPGYVPGPGQPGYIPPGYPNFGR